MITAQEAREKSLYSLQTEKERALKWAQRELPYIENRILDEIKRGRYDTDCWWSKTDLAEAGITQGMAKIALTEILSGFGYQTAYCFNYGAEREAFKVYINWAEEEKNE